MNSVHDETGAGCSTDADRSEDGSEFAAAARAVPEPVRKILGAVHDDRGLGVLCTIDSHGGVAVRDLLRDDLCESDLHGLCAEFRAAGLLEECEIAGERGYCTTELAHEALSHLESD